MPLDQEVDKAAKSASLGWRTIPLRHESARVPRMPKNAQTSTWRDEMAFADSFGKRMARHRTGRYLKLPKESPLGRRQSRRNTNPHESPTCPKTPKLALGGTKWPLHIYLGIEWHAIGQGGRQSCQKCRSRAAENSVATRIRTSPENAQKGPN